EHQRDPGFVRVLLEITRHPLFQIARFANIKRLTRGIEHPINAGTMRQRSQELGRIELGRRRGSSGSSARHLRQTRNLGHATALVVRPRWMAMSSNTARNIVGVSRRVLVLWRLQWWVVKRRAPS